MRRKALKQKKIGIQYSDPESTGWNPESKTVMDSLTWREFLLIPFTIICRELAWKLAGEIGLRLALKRFTSLGPPTNGNESNSKKIPISSKA